MDRIAQAPKEDRAELFRRSAGVLRPERSPAIIEKDFWVCWALHRLFHVLQFRPQLIFKGGTSLSKAYNAIERFSEDVDLSLSRRDLGFADDRDPEQPGTSGKESRRRIATLVEACRQAILDRLLPALRADFASVIDPGEWNAELDAIDPQTVIFTYPRSELGAPFQRPFVPPFGWRWEHAQTTGRRRSGRFVPTRLKPSPRHFRRQLPATFASWMQKGPFGRKQPFCTQSTIARPTRPWWPACRGTTLTYTSFQGRRSAGRRWTAPIF